MGEKCERVDLSVQNKPGVLGRIVTQIRLEGWNIKRLFVDETEYDQISYMEIDIEGRHTKLALVAERMLDIDGVLSVTTYNLGTPSTQYRETAPPREEPDAETQVPQTARKPSGAYRILTINPGSTSTKFALYDDEALVLEHTIRHDRAQLAALGSVFAQKDLRKQSMLDVLSETGTDLSTLDAVSGRGGLLNPIESGTYLINNAMLTDLQRATAAVHASALGAVIAAELASDLNIPAFVVDPIVVDEMDRNAKLTGMPGVERSSIFHALNQKAIAKRLAGELNTPYENLRLVVAHLGGGITVGAHRYGRVIDVNDALSGEGPFTPERSGGLPVTPVIEMCFSGEYTKEEMLASVTKSGGMLAYLGTNDLQKVQKMINAGDEFAALVLDSMAYQVSKEIGSMVAVLEGRVDAIILTGGLAYSSRFTGAIKQRVDRLAPVHVYPGEDEMLALMQGALRVLKGIERVSEYE